jgi:LDH2 family malate/lactate/ureidoglycolate dehydrogenase
MLERFKVPKEDEVRVAHDALSETVSSIFEKMGTSAEDAALGAEVLVTTDLRGVETHGVSNMLRSVRGRLHSRDSEPSARYANRPRDAFHCKHRRG